MKGIITWRKKQKPTVKTQGTCQSRDWGSNPSRRCMRPVDGHTTHAWTWPGTGRGDDKTFYWKDLP